MGTVAGPTSKGEEPTSTQAPDRANDARAASTSTAPAGGEPSGAARSGSQDLPPEPSPVEVRPGLRERVEGLRGRPLVVTQERLKTKRGQPVVCGHSGAVAFQKWDELAASHPDLLSALPPTAVTDLRAFTTGFARGECSMDDLGQCHSGVGAEVGNSPSAGLPTCAVVGNSGKLRGEFHREAIDASDVVIRFNGGVTRGYEEHVGTKSTFRLYNGPYTTTHVPGEAAIAQIRDLASRAWVKSAVKHGDSLSALFDLDFLCQAWDLVDRAGLRPSSGLVGVAFALSQCAYPVSIFGFQYSQYFDPDVQPHYFDWERPKKGREHVHPFSEEAQLLLELQAAGFVALH